MPVQKAPEQARVQVLQKLQQELLELLQQVQVPEQVLLIQQELKPVRVREQLQARVQAWMPVLKQRVPVQAWQPKTERQQEQLRSAKADLTVLLQQVQAQKPQQVPVQPELQVQAQRAPELQVPLQQQELPSAARCRIRLYRNRHRTSGSLSVLFHN